MQHTEEEKSPEVRLALLMAEENAKKNQKKNLYETPCKDCVFATYRRDTQDGCAFDRVEKFRRQGIGVMEVFDDDKEFFVIETACLAHRHKKSPWAMQHPGPTRKAACRKELQREVDVVVVLGEGDTVEQAKVTVDSLLAQTLLPAKVTVVVNRDGILPQAVRDILPGDWIVQFIMERMADGSRISAGRCVDHAVIGSKAHFYAVFKPGFAVPPDFVRSIDNAVSDDLDRFVLLEANEAGQGLVVAMRASHYYGGNAEAVIEGEDAGEDEGKRADSIAEKILHRVKVEGKPHLVKKVVEVCPSLA